LKENFELTILEKKFVKKYALGFLGPPNSGDQLELEHTIFLNFEP
jgi:hypothetical protein